MEWLELFRFLAEREDSVKAQNVAQLNGRINDVIMAHNGLAHVFLVVTVLFGLAMIALAVQLWWTNRKVKKLEALLKK